MKHYAWGGRRRSAGAPSPFIADLLGVEAPVGRPFAELWLGAHPQAPSLVSLPDGREKPLDRLIAADAQFWLGPALTGQGIAALPFLLKILDSEKPLSIQAHPDRETAIRLHRQDPEHYPDANHKPEIAIALDSGLRAFCGFRPVAEVLADWHRLPPLGRFFKDDAPTFAKAGPARAFARLLQAGSEAVGKLLSELSEILLANDRPEARDRCFLELLQEYPGDRGCLSPYFLNLLSLEAGESVFLGANRLHAYLQGTIIECMANSDNVVRAGLTGKFVDCENLLAMLDYRTGTPPVSAGEQRGAGLRVYRGDASEFQVELIEGGAQETVLNSDNAVSIMLVLSGCAEFAGDGWRQVGGRGSAWLWPGALPELRMRSRDQSLCLIRARPRMRPPSVGNRPG